MTPAIKAWAAEMKKAGKFKFFGFSTHTNMADCLSGRGQAGLDRRGDVYLQLPGHERPQDEGSH